MRFKTFLENSQNNEVKIRANIPLDKEVYSLSELFKNHGFELRVVGGAVRDFLFHQKFGKSNEKFKPKDIDLVTNATPEQIKSILTSNEAESMGVRTLEVGAQFGIIVAQMPRKKSDGSIELIDYEIASYRTDSQTGDGRRPDSVSHTNSAALDAQRRDLTINALYYDIPTDPKNSGEIIDYNGGQGIRDIEQKIARPVGDPEQRFTEDQLRVMRLIRFFARYNPGSPEEIEKHDPKTAAALKKFAKMPGVSNERLSAEFLNGLKSAQNPINYLKSLHYFGIISRAFLGLKVAGSQKGGSNPLDRLNALSPSMQRNPRLVLAFLLKDNDPDLVEQTLTKLTYVVHKGEGTEHKLVPHVKFLLELLRFNPQKVYDITKQRDKLYPDAKGGVSKEEIQHYMEQHKSELMAWAMLNNLDLNNISNLTNFQRTINAYDPRLSGKTGPELGRAIKDLEAQNFLNMNKVK